LLDYFCIPIDFRGDAEVLRNLLIWDSNCLLEDRAVRFLVKGAVNWFGSLGHFLLFLDCFLMGIVGSFDGLCVLGAGRGLLISKLVSKPIVVQGKGPATQKVFIQED
jgi:hypothetical protein